MSGRALSAARLSAYRQIEWWKLRGYGPNVLYPMVGKRLCAHLWGEEGCRAQHRRRKHARQVMTWEKLRGGAVI